MSEVYLPTIKEKYENLVSKVVFDLGSNKLNLDQMKQISCASNLFGTFKRNVANNLFLEHQTNNTNAEK